MIRGTFDFLQTSLSPVEEARGVPSCEKGQELMQNTDNEQHTKGKRADVPLRVGVHMSNRGHGVNYLAIPV